MSSIAQIKKDLKRDYSTRTNYLKKGKEIKEIDEKINTNVSKKSKLKDDIDKLRMQIDGEVEYGTIEPELMEIKDQVSLDRVSGKIKEYLEEYIK